MAYAFAVVFVLVVWLAIVYLAERSGLLDAADRFPTPARKWMAYGWLGLFMLSLAVLVTGSALAPPTARQLADAPFYSLFVLHAILTIFTCLAWGIVWLVLALTGGEKRYQLIVDEYGNVHWQNLG